MPPMGPGLPPDEPWREPTTFIGKSIDLLVFEGRGGVRWAGAVGVAGATVLLKRASDAAVCLHGPERGSPHAYVDTAAGLQSL